MRIRWNPWHWLFTALFAAVFSSLISTAEEWLALLIVSYPLGRFSFSLFKRYFFKKAVAFDMGGVVTQGDFYTEELREMPGTRDLIERLRVNYKVALLSNMNALAFVPFDQKFGLSRLFDEVIVSGKVGSKKPDEKIFRAALSKLRVSEMNLYFLDDTAENVVAAEKIGIRGIVFKNAQQAEGELKAMGLNF